MSNLLTSPTWQALVKHHQSISRLHMRDLFAHDPERANNFTIMAADLLFDYSKNRISSETIDKLVALAEAQRLAEKIEQLFSGAPVNSSENRPALHTALRAPADNSIHLKGKDIMLDIQAALRNMQGLVEAIQTKQWLGFSNKPMTDVVNLGIGGSYLAPAMAYKALTAYANPNVRSHFVANIDSDDLTDTLRYLNPETTLFIIASKTFTTQETLENAKLAKRWLQSKAGDSVSLEQHFIAITAYPERAEQYGIHPAHILPIWEWVGGRYSLWSTMGFALAVTIGMDNFKQLLAGAHAMDVHFRNAPLKQNMPVILAMLGIWYTNFFGAKTQAILPYSHRLDFFVDYLLQLEMESNGKRVQHDGSTVDYATCPIIWGGVGTNSQHAFHQLLFQGTHLVPADFIIAAKGGESQPLVFSHCLAQSQALMEGVADKTLPAYQQIPGNQPNNIIVLPELSPYYLGALIALYEHKVFTQSIIWNINCFDQWGVELGKKLAKEISSHLKISASQSKSMNPILDYYQRLSQ